MHSIVRIGDISVGMYVREIGSFGRLDGKSCTNCRDLCTVYSCTTCAHSAHIEKKNYCE